MSLLEQRAGKKMEIKQVRDKPQLHSREDTKFEEIWEYVRETLLVSGNLSMVYDQDTRPKLKETIFQLITEKYPQMSRLDRAGITESVLDDIIGYGPIQPLIDDPEITDIMVNRYDRIFFRKQGKPYRSEIQFRDEKHLRNVIEKIVSTVGRRVDESSATVDARMPDGSRINAVVPPIALDGAALTIRRFMYNIDADELLQQGVVTREQLQLLEKFIRARLNIIVSGGTGTGKTTFLNVLSQFIPQGERVITIEDVAELRLKIPDLVRLETRGVNIEGKGDVSAQALVANVLRMNPDRIIVGECRRGEAFDMLQAMNTGHEGSLTTLHANTPSDALSRLENMVLMSGYSLPVSAIRDQIASAIHIIIHLNCLRDGKRVVTHISEVTRRSDSVITQDLYRRKNGELAKVQDPCEEILARME
ncbi:MAG: ATPase, T2SS/T4P/T4SS family [Firmicutes bacterium]|nr:ATPase, T2SS/T4P/T4SS family [Bacillota bacterium]